MSTHNRVAPCVDHSPKWGKRAFDLLFSASVLIFGSPLYLLLILLVKCTSKGPAFYKGLRAGIGGKPIYCLKFRTMCVDADQRLNQLLESDPALKREWEIYHKLKKDPRLTPIGAFLRKTSLDELPQFWNALKGDLSVVGPRPIAVESEQTVWAEMEGRYGRRAKKILSVRPGITCIWQTQGRNTLTFEQRAHLEEVYVDTQTFFLDLILILKTIRVVLFPKGAY